jgi:hypothetical protein
MPMAAPRILNLSTIYIYISRLALGEVTSEALKHRLDTHFVVLVSEDEVTRSSNYVSLVRWR